VKRFIIHCLATFPVFIGAVFAADYFGAYSGSSFFAGVMACVLSDLVRDVIDEVRA